MMLANIIVFTILIVVVCAVDLSTFFLDESSERLLYDLGEKDTEECESDVPEETAEQTSEEFSENGDDENIQDAINEVEEIAEESAVSESIAPESTESPVEAGVTSERSSVSEETVSDEDLDGYLARRRERRRQRQQVTASTRNLDDVRHAIDSQAVPTHNLSEKITEASKQIEKSPTIKVPNLGVNSKRSAPRQHIKRPRNVETVTPEEDDIGMSTDFSDDFEDISDLIRNIHDQGGK